MKVEAAKTLALVMALLRHAIPILLRPKSEWLAIAAETTTPLKLYLGYIIPLSAIEPVAMKVRLIEYLYGNPRAEEFVPILSVVGLTPMDLTANYVWHLIEIYLLAVFMSLIAPVFSGDRNLLQALKVLAFSFTSMWIGQIFIAIPIFSLDRSMVILSLIYTGYLLYLGFSVLMKVSSPGALLYTGVVMAAHWGALWSREAAIPAVMDFLRQWPVLSRDTKTTVLVILLTLTIVALVVFYGRSRKSN
jgi:hypothetical protein